MCPVRDQDVTLICCISTPADEPICLSLEDAGLSNGSWVLEKYRCLFGFSGEIKFQPQCTHTAIRPVVAVVACGRAVADLWSFSSRLVFVYHYRAYFHQEH